MLGTRRDRQSLLVVPIRPSGISARMASFIVYLIDLYTYVLHYCT